MLHFKKPTGRFGQTGRFFDFLFTWGGLNIVLVKLVLHELLDAPTWLMIAAWTLLGVSLFAGFYLRWVPRRAQGMTLPGSHTGDGDARVEWQLPEPDSTR